MEEDVLEGSDEDEGGVDVEKGPERGRNDVGGVDDRGEPEPDLDDDPDDFAKVSQKDRERRENQAESVGEYLLDGEYGGDPDERPRHRDADEQERESRDRAPW